MKFRDFLYYDTNMVESFLSIVEGGIYDEEDRHVTLDTSGAAPGEEEVLSDRFSTTDSRRKVVRQTEAARFDRLFGHVSDSEDVLTVGSGDRFSLTDAEDDRFCEIKGVVEIPPAINAIMNAATFRAAGEFVDRIGMLDAEGRKVIEQLGYLDQAREAIGDTPPLVLKVASSPSLIMPLRQEFIVRGFNDLEGRATVYGRVAETIPASSRYPLIKIPGQQLTRQQRRKAARSSSDDAAYLKGPATILHVLAIYR
ncbi:DUF6414 family protein [Labedaea rhizosphaerae]|uniref:DUF6414 family protein n=1 Tax=Labedaea rhizosphaerae TaxID=598644 RepID=UPI001061CFF9|nr:hypothetical protein [Labedaea rhizosphaerae]